MSGDTTYELVPRPPVPSGTALVVGLGRSGISAAKLLAGRGHRVIAVDSGSPRGADTLGDFGIDTRLSSDGVDCVDVVEFIVKSPGVPPTAPVIEAATLEGKLVIGELELGWRSLNNPFIAITGTNGKTTTTELLGQIYRDAGLPVAVAGNVGTPVCDLVGQLDPEATVVCEASSYQLEDAPEFRPECGVLLNLAPDHIDRHGSFAAYRDAKLSMFAGQGPGQFAVTGPSVDVEVPGDGRKYRVPAPDLSAVDDSILMHGAHNKENAVIATQAAMLMGVDPFSISRTLATFAGLPNRMELVTAVRGVEYVNDSKATNVAATVAALESFERTARLILGGSPKGEDYAPLRAAVERACAAVYLNGETAADLADSLSGVSVPVERHDTLPGAFTAASTAARPGETVLLSPAAASFDQFPDYEARGEAFRNLVAELKT